MNDARTLPMTFGPHKGANGKARITGPCGDTMEFWLTIADQRIARATFTTDGCGDSLACGDTAARMASGAALDVARRIGQADILAMVSGIPEESRHCALLAANVLHAAIADYLATEKEKCDRADGDCGSCGKEDCTSRQKSAERSPASEDGRLLRRRMSKIGHKIVVLSGKGGVGKSTVAVNLAMTLAAEGCRVGLLDADIHGPSVATMLGLCEHRTTTNHRGIVPADFAGIKVVSVAFFLKHQDHAVIWRGPMKMGVIKQFLKDVDWGELDYLIVDCPPGTGDEPLSVCQLLETVDGAVVVTTPQQVAVADVRKSINFCHQLSIPVLGVVENMSGFACPACGTVTSIFQTGGGERMARDFAVPFLGRIPIDPAVGQACDEGTPFVRRFAASATAAVFAQVAAPVLRLSHPPSGNRPDENNAEQQRK